MGEVSTPTEVGAHECIWTDDEGRPWYVRAMFDRIGERQEVVGMELRSVRQGDEARLAGHLPKAGDGAGTPLSSKIWRAMGVLPWAMRHHYVQALDESGLLDSPGLEEAAAAWRAPKDRVEARLKDVAAAYREAVDAEKSTTDAISRQFGLSPSAAAKRVQRARKAGLLPPAKRGRRARNEQQATS